MAIDRPASTAAKLPHSRLCSGSLKPSKAVPEQPYLFESLRELAFETSLNIAGITLRIGLAASVWQFEQARLLLENFTTLSNDSFEFKPQEQAIAIALHISPCNPRAQAVISLRRDSEEGLSLDKSYQSILNNLRARGSSLAEVEQLAFKNNAPVSAMLDPMIHALSNSIEMWGATDILAESATKAEAYFYNRFGFKRLENNPENPRKTLFCLTASCIQSLQARLSKTE